MEVQGNKVTKLCSFYVSDWHFVTMLLPYMNRKINEQAKIATILEKSIKEEVTTLVEKLNLKNKENILNLNWEKTEERKHVFSHLEEKEEIIIIVNGKREFIKAKNLKLEQYLQTHRIKQEVKIINCYEVTQLDGSVSDILEEHDKILNTSGEKEIEEVFPDYQKSNHVEIKAVVGLE